MKRAILKRKTTKPSAWGVGLTATVLSALCLLIIWERFHTYHEPLYTNLVCYASFGRELLAGKKLYVDLWDHKPPGIFLTYALSEAVAGSGKLALYLLSVGAGIAGLFGVYRTVRFIHPSVFPALMAAGLWAVVSGDLGLEANRPDMEVFINAFLVWALALMVEKEGALSVRRSILIGALWAAASFYKHYVLVDAIALGLAYMAMGPPREFAKRRQSVLWGLGTVVGFWVVIFGYFLITGRFQAFWEALVSFNLYYSGDMGGNIANGLFDGHFVPGKLIWVWPFVLFLLAGFILGVRQQKTKWVLFAVFCAAKYLEVVLPGRYTTHYYQLWLPAIAVGFGWSICALEKQWNRKTAALLAVLLMGFAVVYEAKWCRLSPMESSRVKYGTDYEAVPAIVKVVQETLQPGETYFEWSDVPRFYYDVGTPLPARYLFNFLMFRGPLTDRMANETIEDLERSKPELVVFDRLWRPDGWQNHKVFGYLKEKYKAYRAMGLIGRFELQYRIGGKLEKRLEVKK